MRGFLEISQNKLPKRAFCAQGFRQFSQKKLLKRSFRARLLRNFTEQASKTSVSHDASDNFHRKSFQNDRFVRCFFEISQNKLPKRSFRARPPRNFTEEARKINVSCEASSKFHRRSFQNDRFVQGFLQFSQNKLPKRTFRAMLPTIFTEKASKTIVSCDASSKFHRTSFQNERFARCFRKFSQKKLPKRSFRAMLLRNFTEQASKTSVSHEASDNFHRKSFQNDRFVRGFLEISKNKPPKRTFRARLLPNFTEKASKTIVSCEASSKFHRTKLPKRSFRARPPPNFTEQASKTNVSREASSIFHRTKLPKRAFRARLLPNLTEEASKMIVSCEASSKFYRTMLPKRTFRVARCFRQFPEKICISPQFRATDPPNPTRGFIQQKQNVRLATAACHPKFQNARFTTAACAKMYESSARRPRQPAAYKNHHFTTVSDI